MSLTEQVRADMTAAMKAKEAERLSTLRMLQSALKNEQIEKMHELSDAEASVVIRRAVKQRQDSIEQFSKAGRTELVEKEQAELAILKAFLPASATDEEIKAEVDKAAAALGSPTAKDMGAVMKAAMAALKETGKVVDGKKVSDAVKARLA